MALRSFFAALPFSLLFWVASSGCHGEGPRPAPVPTAPLESRDDAVREKTAAALAEGEGPPPSAVRPLISAIRKEANPKVYGAMLIALGASGVAEARPFIDARVNDPDGDMQRWARVALKRWLVRNFLMAQEETLPPPPHRLYGPITPPPGAPGAQPSPELAP